jgi:branched-chain amino acid transport system permease protein
LGGSAESDSAGLFGGFPFRMTTLGQLFLSGIFIGGIYALMSMGLTLIFGVLRVVNFAHGEFLMLAMYGAWAITRVLGLNPYIAAIAIVPAMFLFGAIVHQIIVRPALDKPHLVVVFATMGLSIFMQNVALMIMTADLWDVPPIFDHSVEIGPFYFKAELLLGFAATILCTLFLQWLIRTTYLGKAIRATVQDGEAAMLMGIPVPRIFLITFASGSALVGLGACMMMPLFSVFPTVGLNFVLIAFVIVVLGGMGSIEGALIGGMCIGVVQSISSYYVAPAYGQMFYFILFLLVMIFRPNGLLGQKGAATIGIND